jgi:hypothetical protein
MVQRAPAITLATARSRVRELVGDTDTVTVNQRWLDDVVDQALNDQLVRMQTRITGVAPAEALVRVTMSYGSGAEAEFLPDECNLEGIYKVENITDPARPVPVQPVGPTEIELYTGAPGGDSNITSRRAPGYRYTIIGADADAADVAKRQILLRPKPRGGVTLRIGFLAPGFVLEDDDDDVVPLSPKWTRCLTLGAAVILREPFAQAPPEQMIAYEREWAEFARFAEKIAGPQRVRRRRRGKS